MLPLVVMAVVVVAHRAAVMAAVPEADMVAVAEEAVVVVVWAKWFPLPSRHDTKSNSKMCHLLARWN